MTTQYSTICEPWAVVLVRFRFTDGSDVKQRPAVIVSNRAYHASRADTIMLGLSTRISPTYFGDVDILDWMQAGLTRPTKAKGTLQTIERGTVVKRLGTLSAQDMQRVQQSIKDVLAL